MVRFCLFAWCSVRLDAICRALQSIYGPIARWMMPSAIKAKTSARPTVSIGISQNQPALLSLVFHVLHQSMFSQQSSTPLDWRFPQWFSPHLRNLVQDGCAFVPCLHCVSVRLECYFSAHYQALNYFIHYRPLD